MDDDLLKLINDYWNTYNKLAKLIQDKEIDLELLVNLIDTHRELIKKVPHFTM